MLASQRFRLAPTLRLTSARRAGALLAAFAVAAAGCEKKDAAHEAPAPQVVVVPVAQRDVDITQEWVGTTKGFVNAQIFPKVQGYLLRRAYTEGGTVAAGDLLFEIDPRQYKAALDEAKGELGRAQAALGKSEIDVKRYTPLVAQGAVSQQELDDALQARLANRAAVDSARAALENAQLNLEWTKVRAPIAGVAAIATAQVGDLVSPQTLLTEVSQLDPILVSFELSEVDYLHFAERLRQLQTATQTDPPALALILANGATYPHEGSVYVTGLAVATTTGTITVQGKFPNPDNLLRPGQFAKVRGVTERRPGALVIPQRAVSELQGTQLVAVVGPDDQVTQKRVKLGPITGSEFVVNEGLAPGDRIVVEGLQKIREGMTVKPVTEAQAAAAKTPEAGN